jgi:hypothetical protein
MSDTLRIRIPEKDLQDKFNRNEGGFPSEIATLRRRNIYDELASPKSRQVPGTRSIVDQYYNDKQRVMTLHYFQKPDGTLGGSRKMDPKELLVGDTMYFK